jgi:hypothetical protein
MADAVREFLEAEGCPEHMIEAGLDGLIEQWEYAVEDVEEGYPLGFDDYLDDMDSRQLLEGSLAVAPAEQRRDALPRVRAADERMKELLVTAPGCLWGADAAAEHGWTAEKNWWYFRVPREPGPELAEDIKERL